MLVFLFFAKKKKIIIRNLFPFSKKSGVSMLRNIHIKRVKGLSVLICWIGYCSTNMISCGLRGTYLSKSTEAVAG
jgi:hypothetical protein